MPATKPIYGNPNGHDTINGTAGDDFIVALGPDSTIVTNGGADFINAGRGGARVRIGGPANPPVAAGRVTVNLQGSGNRVESYLGSTDGTGPQPSPTDAVAIDTGTVSVVGYGGNNTLILGRGSTNVSLGGTDNSVHLGNSTSTVRLTGGNGVVTIGDSFQGPAIDATVSIAGLGNVVGNSSSTFFFRFGYYDRAGRLSITGGAGNGRFLTGGADTTLSTSGLNNVVTVGHQGTSTIAPGDGGDTVLVGQPGPPGERALANVTINLRGQGNTVGGLAASLTVNGGDGRGTFNLTGARYDDGSSYVADYGLVDPPDQFYLIEQRSYTVDTAGSFNRYVLDDTNLNTVTNNGSNATVLLQHPFFTNQGDPPPDASTVPTRLATLNLTGGYETVTAGDGSVKLALHGGHGSVSLGNGNNTVLIDGAQNTTVLGSGHNTVTSAGQTSAAYGNRLTVGAGQNDLSVSGTGDIVRLDGGTDKLNITGTNGLVFLQNGVTAAVSGAAQALRLDVASGNIRATVAAEVFAAGQSGGGAVLFEKGTVTQTSAAQLYAALQDDGAGGRSLALAAGGFVDFKGAIPVFQIQA